MQEYEGSKTIEAVQWTGENIQDVWETVRCCATSQEIRILPATGRIEIIWYQSRETAFPGDYFVKPEVSSRLQIIKVMGKKYFEENYRIKQDNSMRNSENGQIRDLKDTINLMTSDDYKDRLLAEYWQLKIRHQKLQVAIARKSQRLDRDTKTPIDALQAQSHVMERYLNLLRLRAREEGIIIGEC